MLWVDGRPQYSMHFLGWRWVHQHGCMQGADCHRCVQVTSTEIVLAAKQKKKYANAHTYHVNSIALSSDQETFITADDLRINLWNLEFEDQAFNVVDMKPPNMEELTEVSPLRR